MTAAIRVNLQNPAILRRPRLLQSVRTAEETAAKKVDKKDWQSILEKC